MSQRAPAGRRTVLGGVTPLLLLLPVACGAGGEGQSQTSTTTSTTAIEVTSTTHCVDNPCFKFPVEVLRLQNDYRMEVRGIVPPDEGAYRARAQALVDEAAELGCPRPAGLSSFLD